MAYLPGKTTNGLVSSLATCGGINGPLFLVAKELQRTKEGELWDMLPDQLHPLASQSMHKLEEVAEQGVITPSSVLFRYGLPAHFREMNTEVQLGAASVAREIPAEIRAVAHTLLPLNADGTYRNKECTISFKGLVPLGPQEGILVAHLSGVFASTAPRSL